MARNKMFTLEIRLLRFDIDGMVSRSSSNALFIALTRFLSRKFRFSMANDNF